MRLSPMQIAVLAALRKCERGGRRPEFHGAWKRSVRALRDRGLVECEALTCFRWQMTDEGRRVADEVLTEADTW